MSLSHKCSDPPAAGEPAQPHGPGKAHCLLSIIIDIISKKAFAVNML